VKLLFKLGEIENTYKNIFWVWYFFTDLYFKAVTNLAIIAIIFPYLYIPIAPPHSQHVLTTRPQTQNLLWHPLKEPAPVYKSHVQAEARTRAMVSSTRHCAMRTQRA
jgi:hypothetical protein